MRIVNKTYGNMDEEEVSAFERSYHTLGLDYNGEGMIIAFTEGNEEPEELRMLANKLANVIKTFTRQEYGGLE